jgi:hypothetical protein
VRYPRSSSSAIALRRDAEDREKLPLLVRSRDETGAALRM